MKNNDIYKPPKKLSSKGEKIRNHVIICVVIIVVLVLWCKYLNGQNLLENPGFETGELSPWQVQEQFPGQCYIDTVHNSGQYSASIEIISPGEFWEVQLFQLLNLKQGQRYILDFWHKSEAPAEIILNLCGHEDPWPNLGLWDSVATDTNWIFYSTNFIVFDTTLARLSFNFGHQHSKFWVDGVYLAESIYVDPEPPPPPDPEDVENIYLYPNPFHSKICLARPEETLQQRVLVYNIIGQKLDVELEGSLLNFADEPPGVYFVTVGNQIKKIVKLEQL